MATKMARAMVTQYGLSDILGPLAYGENEEEVFLGHSVTRHQNISAETAKLIDQEVRRIVEESYDRARQILTEQEDKLHLIANALLEYETLSGEDIRALLRGETLHREDEEDTEPTPQGPAAAVPTSGRPRSGPAPEGPMEPQPQGS